MQPLELSQECERNSIHIAEYVPKLEYASAAWHPFLRKDISALERVQCKLCSMVLLSHRYASLTHVIRDFGRGTLEMRRRQFI